MTTAEGVNDELWPVVRMTVPGGSDLVIRPGALGRSWILLFGVLPIDYDDLFLSSVSAGAGFRERSTIGSCSEWHHDRSLLSLPGGGCRVVDSVGFTPRVALFGGLMAFLFEATFRWRHRRLRRRFGVAD